MSQLFFELKTNQVLFKISNFKFPRSYFSAPQTIRKMFLILSTSNFNTEYLMSKPIIHNLSNLTIPKEINSLLNFGGKFIPTNKSKINLHELFQCSHELQRDIKIKHHFLLHQSLQKEKQFNPKFHLKSDWTPPHIHPQIEPLLQTIDKIITKRAVNNKKLTNNYHQNINKNIIFKSKQFLSNNSLLIKASDKNMGLTIIPINWYNEQITNHLQDEQTYNILGTTDFYNLSIKESMSLKFDSMINSLYDNYPNSFTNQEKTFLTNESASKLNNIPQFHLLPKLHKTPIKTRPIVPNINTICTNLSIYVSDKLQTLNKYFKWVLKDTNILIDHLNKMHLTQPYSIITADVTALYTNIPIETGINNLRQLINKYKSHIPNLQFIGSDTIVCTLTKFIMENNIFKYNEYIVQQIKGVAMGTNMAPEFASLFLVYYEINIIKLLKDKDIYYYRYIDDIIIFHPTNINPLDLIRKEFNPPVEIIWENTSTDVNFLDLHIEIKNDKAQYELYVKPQNAFQYVPFKSAHPFGVKKGIIYGNTKRIITHCSTKELRLKHIKKFYMILRNRGYPNSFLMPLLLKAFNKFTLPTNDPSRNIIQAFNRPPIFIIRGSYHPFWESKLTKTMIKKLKISLKSFYQILQFNPMDNITLSLKRSPNLFDSLNTSNKNIIEISNIDLTGNKRRKLMANQNLFSHESHPDILREYYLRHLRN